WRKRCRRAGRAPGVLAHVRGRLSVHVVIVRLFLQPPQSRNDPVVGQCLPPAAHPCGNRSRTFQCQNRGSCRSGNGSRTISRNSSASRRCRIFELASERTNTTLKISPPEKTNRISDDEPDGNLIRPVIPLRKLNRRKIQTQKLKPITLQTALSG